ncbi:MAG: hypothetical protein HY890_09305 [Deltaproteobacteria bacterium]|nr:hypothetical protein [Deltaproteobacteria bacterium]
MTEEAKEDFKKGLRSLKKGDMEEAVRAFEKAYRADKENPAFMYYYGMASALKWGKIGTGLELCTKAIKKEFFKAEYYLNLGHVYLASGNKKGAVTVIKKGLRFEPENENLHEMLISLGARKRQIIPLLGRSNPINKYLGIFFRRTLPDFMKKARAGKKSADDNGHEAERKTASAAQALTRAGLKHGKSGKNLEDK